MNDKNSSGGLELQFAHQNRHENKPMLNMMQNFYVYKSYVIHRKRLFFLIKFLIQIFKDFRKITIVIDIPLSPFG